MYGLEDGGIFLQHRELIQIKTLQTIIHQRRKHPKCFLLVVRNKPHKSGDEIHPLTITNLWVMIRIRAQNSKQDLLRDSVKPWIVWKRSPDVRSNKCAPLVRLALDGVVKLGNLFVFDIQTLFPNLPAVFGWDPFSHAAHKRRIMFRNVRIQILTHVPPLFYPIPDFVRSFSFFRWIFTTPRRAGFAAAAVSI